MENRQMKIIAADSACSTLDPSFMPRDILNSAVVLLDHPYREPLQARHVTADYKLSDPNVLVYELRLCAQMLEEVEADCIHLDFSMGGVNILSLTDAMLERMIVSSRGYEILRFILPDLQGLAVSIGEKYKVPVYAMGDKSAAVRVAELTAAAGGVALAARRALTAEAPTIIGLPRHTRAVFEGDQVSVISMDPMEEGLAGRAEAPEHVEVEAFLNPVARQFQTLKFSPRAF
jgi:hypothetical protein